MAKKNETPKSQPNKIKKSNTNLSEALKRVKNTGGGDTDKGVSQQKGGGTDKDDR